MIFRRITLSAIAIGILAGVFLSLLQTIDIIPIIEQAEQYETHHDTAQAEHHHTSSTWAPSDGVERTGYTAATNILVTIGFTLLLVSLMSYQGNNKISIKTGLLWGLAGYTTFFIAPSIGLPPDIPGTESAPLLERQAWWLMTVVCTGAGLAMLVFGKRHFIKLLGLGIILLPQLIGPPAFDHPSIDANLTASLQALTADFMIASSLTNALYWLTIGLLASAVVKHYIHR